MTMIDQPDLIPPLDYNNLDLFDQPLDEFALTDESLLPENSDFAWTSFEDWLSQDVGLNYTFNGRS